MINWLFDTSMGQPGPTGNWPLWLSILFHVSNGVIAITYLILPALKFAYGPYQGSGLTNKQYWKIMIYLPVMAADRIVRVFEIWGPPYHLTTILDVASAIATVYSIYHLVHIFAHTIVLHSSKDFTHLQDEIKKKDLNIELIQERNERFISSINEQLNDVIGSKGLDYKLRSKLIEIRTLVELQNRSI